VRADQTGVPGVMIRSGLCHITVEMLGGIKGGNQGVMVMCDGSMRGEQLGPEMLAEKPELRC
jgi:hypothetical protein